MKASSFVKLVDRNTPGAIPGSAVRDGWQAGGGVTVKITWNGKREDDKDQMNARIFVATAVAEVHTFQAVR
ncbi:MAG TPA: hypothetical protein DCW29_00565 [Janthinobacterium sp.]|nr:hypothetical protein [Janthinobacterium sp.]